MRWTEPPPRSAAEAVAHVHAELAAFPAGGEPQVIWWAPVTRPAIVLGRAAGSSAEIEARATAAGLDVARRPSGGGPVLWDADVVAFDVILPRGHPLASDDVVASYAWLGALVEAALRSIGLNATLLDPRAARRLQAERAGDPTASLCFGGLSPYEVLVDGRKVLGLCQARRTNATLLQAGLGRAFDHDRLAQLAGVDGCGSLLAERIGAVPPEAIGPLKRALAGRLA